MRILIAVAATSEAAANPTVVQKHLDSWTARLERMKAKPKTEARKQRMLDAKTRIKELKATLKTATKGDVVKVKKAGKDTGATSEEKQALVDMHHDYEPKPKARALLKRLASADPKLKASHMQIEAIEKELRVLDKTPLGTTAERNASIKKADRLVYNLNKLRTELIDTLRRKHKISKNSLSSMGLRNKAARARKK